MNKMKKLIFLFILAFSFIVILPTGFFSFAQTDEELPTPDSYVEKVIEEMPEDVKTHLPDGSTYEELAQNADSDYLLSLSLAFLRQSLNSIYTYLSYFVVALLLGSLAKRIEDAFGKPDMEIASYVVLLVIAFEAFFILHSLFEEVSEFCKKISSYMLGVTATMGSVSLLGGGTMISAKGVSTVSITVTLLGTLCSTLLLPIIRLSFASSFSSIASQKINLSSFSSFFRNIFTFLIGFVSIVSIVVITFQTMLAQAEDSLAARSIRFAASSSIPIVGNAVGDSVRTLGAAVAVIQKSVGTIGAVGIVIMTLYPLSILFSAKIAFSLSKAIAGLLDIHNAEGLLSQSCHLINMLLATVAILSILYIFITALYTGTTIPIA